jgi:hypothetical protein
VVSTLNRKEVWEDVPAHSFDPEKVLFGLTPLFPAQPPRELEETSSPQATFHGSES